MSPCSVSIYAGTDPVTLRLWLAEAFDVYRQLRLGKQVVSASYSQGDGSRSVSYSGTAAIPQVMNEIAQIQRALGIPVTFGRRAIGVRF